MVTLDDLIARFPAEDLLSVLKRGVEENHPWCRTTAPRVLRNGGALSPLQRGTLEEIRGEQRDRQRCGRRADIKQTQPESGATYEHPEF